MTVSPANLAIWAIAALATAGVILRPFKLPEAVWAVAGAVLLVGLGLLPWADGLRGVEKGGDVYLFLIGMMLLSETARREGLFDWVAAAAVNRAARSPRRLFLLIYVVGVVVTTFLSNDAAAVVLTPAVFAAARKAKVEPLPLLFICAFIANAASFAQRPRRRSCRAAVSVAFGRCAPCDNRMLLAPRRWASSRIACSNSGRALRAVDAPAERRTRRPELGFGRRLLQLGGCQRVFVGQGSAPPQSRHPAAQLPSLPPQPFRLRRRHGLTSRLSRSYVYAGPSAEPGSAARLLTLIDKSALSTHSGRWRR